MRWNWPGIVMICCCVAGPLCEAAQPAPDASATTDITDEVLVRGTRLRELKAAIVAAEDRFYARYNELNKVDAFDIECATDAHTGTKLKQRRCLTRLQLEARARNALETLQMFQEQDLELTGRPPTTDHRSGGRLARALRRLPGQHALPAEDESGPAAAGQRK